MPVAPSDPAAGCRETHGVESSTSPAAPHSFPKPRCAGLGNTRQRDPRPAPARWGRRRLRAGARRGLALALKTVLWGAQARVHVVKGYVARTAPGHLAIIEAPGTVAGPGRRRPVTAAMPPASYRHCFALCRAFWRSPRAHSVCSCLICAAASMLTGRPLYFPMAFALAKPPLLELPQQPD